MDWFLQGQEAKTTNSGEKWRKLFVTFFLFPLCYTMAEKHQKTVVEGGEKRVDYAPVPSSRKIWPALGEREGKNGDKKYWSFIFRLVFLK